MKKIILFLFMSLVMMATTLNAQNTVHESKVFDNVYVSLNAGAIVPTNDIAFDAVRPTFGFEIGKQMNTYYTMGLGVNTAINTLGKKTAFDEADFMWIHKVNVFNLFKYDPERKFELEAVGEMGLGHDMVISDWYGIVAAGIEGTYNFNKTWALVAKPRVEWYRINSGMNVNRSNFGISIGIKYRFPNTNGDRGFKVCDRDALQLRYNELNAEVNDLRQRYEGQKKINDALTQQYNELKESKPTKEIVYVDNGFVPSIGFLINSSEISTAFNGNLYIIAKNLKGKKIVVEGYADAKTGTKEYNKQLSQRRAEAVRDALVKQGLNAEDIEVRACGSDSQYFEDNDMNRAVVLLKK